MGTASRKHPDPLPQMHVNIVEQAAEETEGAIMITREVLGVLGLQIQTWTELLEKNPAPGIDAATIRDIWDGLRIIDHAVGKELSKEQSL